MESLEHGKQNLWWDTEGHCTKCVSSNLSLQIVHFKLLLVLPLDVLVAELELIPLELLLVLVVLVEEGGEVLVLVELEGG